MSKKETFDFKEEPLMVYLPDGREMTAEEYLTSEEYKKYAEEKKKQNKK